MKEHNFFFYSFLFFCISEKLDVAACGVGVGETVVAELYLPVFFIFFLKVCLKD